jgi:ribosomal protein S18 acetylase RimI-like enzyme
MLTLRNLRWPEDRQAILTLDTSFTTGRVYRVVAAANAFTLHEATVSPPLRKVYDLTAEVDSFPALERVWIAELAGRAAGVAALYHDSVDRRAIVRHLYIDRAFRRQGIGQALMEAMAAQARQWQARCLWLETQDVNYDAIRFYRRLGFKWCGLDLSLDERDGSPTDETAVFFMRLLE